MTTKPIAASSPPCEGFFVSNGLAEPIQLGDLFQLATPDMSSNVAKQEISMTLHSGNLKRQDSDFAVVIYDTPFCQQTIVKSVQVRGPARWGVPSNMSAWPIKPLKLTNAIIIEIIAPVQGVMQ